MLVRLRNTAGDEHDERWHFGGEKKEKKNEAAEVEALWKACGLDVEGSTSECWLLPQLWEAVGVRGSPLTFWAFFYKL